MPKLKPVSQARLARLLHLLPNSPSLHMLPAKDVKLYYYLWVWGCGRFSGVASNLQDRYFDACGIHSYLSRIGRVSAVIEQARATIELAKELAKQPLPLGKRVRP
jgi:hypothetical protein